MPVSTPGLFGTGGAFICAFLDTLAHSEIGPKQLGRSDNGYNVLVGGGLFSGYKVHPGKSVYLPRYKVYSTAAGRYQFLAKTWTALQKQLGLPDFGPRSQDLGAVELIRGRGALADLCKGDFDTVLVKCSKEWASLPGAGYGQAEKSREELRKVFNVAVAKYTGAKA